MRRSSARTPRQCSRFVIAVVAVAGVALLAAGCGTARAPGAAPATAGGRPATTVKRTSAPGDSRAGAQAYARRLLASLQLPPGARVVPWTARTASGLAPSSPEILSDTLDLKVLYRVRLPMDGISVYLLAHRPHGDLAGGYGYLSHFGSVTSEFVDFAPQALPAGIFSAGLDATFETAPGGGSLLRADAQVAWYPPRSPADHVDPSRYTSVTVSHRMNKSVTSRTFTSPQEVTKLAALVNALYGAPDVVSSGGGGIAGKIDVYEIGFYSTRGAPPVVVSPAGLFYITVTVGGRDEPSLWPAASVVSAASRLLRRG